MSNQKKVVIIDFQLGNMFSVMHACEKLKLSAVISSSKEDILRADAMILPGVGAFQDAMENLKELDLIEPIKGGVKSGKPLFGICLGMQVLFEESEEFGINKGIGLIEGAIKRFPNEINGNRLKVPQIGWNKVLMPSNGSNWMDSPLAVLKNGDYQYFVHSYYASPKKEEVKLSITNYDGFEYCSSIKKNNIFATQFHPEKSGEYGINIYKKWAQINNLL